MCPLIRNLLCDLLCDIVIHDGFGWEVSFAPHAEIQAERRRFDFEIGWVLTTAAG